LDKIINGIFVRANGTSSFYGRDAISCDSGTPRSFVIASYMPCRAFGPCSPGIFSGLPIPGYQPQYNAQFGIGSRTGGEYTSHAIDDLTLQLFVDQVSGIPRITGVKTNAPNGLNIMGTASPNQNVSRM
jgi:hypothetical protein